MKSGKQQILFLVYFDMAVVMVVVVVVIEYTTGHFNELKKFLCKNLKQFPAQHSLYDTLNINFCVKKYTNIFT